MASVSIGQRFLAGVIMGLTMMLTGGVVRVAANYGSDTPFSAARLGKAVMAASAWALFLGFVWFRTLEGRKLVRTTMDTIETTATVLFNVAAASIFGWLLTVTRCRTQWRNGFSPTPTTRGYSCRSPTC